MYILFSPNEFTTLLGGGIPYYLKNCQTVSFLCNWGGVWGINISFGFFPSSSKRVISCFSALERGMVIGSLTARWLVEYPVGCSGCYASADPGVTVAETPLVNFLLQMLCWRSLCLLPQLGPLPCLGAWVKLSLESAEPQCRHILFDSSFHWRALLCLQWMCFWKVECNHIWALLIEIWNVVWWCTVSICLLSILNNRINIYEY